MKGSDVMFKKLLLLIVCLCVCVSGNIYASATAYDASEPIKIEGVKTYQYDSKITNPAEYATDIKVFNRAGKEILPMYFKTTATAKVNGPGHYKIKTTFTRSLSKYKPLETTITITPKTPKLTIWGNCIKKHSIEIFVVGNNKRDYDSIQIYYSRHKDFKNAKTKTYKYKESHAFNGATSTKCQIPYLSENTTYYIKVRFKKTVGNKTIYSNFANTISHTTQSKPNFSPNNKHVKTIIQKMKQNKSFNYTFSAYYNENDLWDFYHDIERAFPQYTCRYKTNLSTNPASNNCSKLTCQIQKNNITKGQTLAKRINSIAANANKKGSNREKVKYIDKYICNNCKYDYDLYHGKNDTPSNPSYSAYGCIVKHKAVCHGYSAAFNAIATKCNITSSIVYSKNHSWNKVKLGNTWYHVDSTWNDTTGTKNYLLTKNHKK